MISDEQFNILVRKMVDSVDGKPIDRETREFFDQYIRLSKGMRTAFSRWLETRKTVPAREG